MTLEQQVRTWLAEQGYPLEMQVAEQLRASRLYWDHGRVYRDPETGKVREIDLMGYLDGIGKDLSVQLVFECKHSKSKPWVLFCTDRSMLNKIGFVHSVPANRVANGILRSLDRRPELQALTFFRKPPLVGFNLVRTHTGNQDAAFHAVRGLTTASTVLSRQAKSGSGVAIFYIPVIVVNSPIMQCHLPELGAQVHLEEVRRGLLLHGWEESDEAGARRVHTSVHVVHVNFLSEFLREVTQDTATLARVAAEPANPD